MELKYYLDPILACTTILIAVLFALMFALGFTPAFADMVPNLPFDNATYFFDHAFRLNVTDPTSIETIIYVNVTSSAQPAGYLYPLDLVDASLRIYQSPYINFTTAWGSTNVMLKIPDPSLSPQINAYYPPANTTPSATSTVIVSDYGVWPPIAMSPQPQWSKRISNCSSYGGETDGDGICANWELSTGLKIPYMGGTPPPSGFWTYPCGSGTMDPVCPSNTTKDVYVEVDWMKGHKPSTTAIENVKTAFNQMGIRLHVLIDEELPLHFDTRTAPIAGGAGSTDFDTIKKAFFGTVLDRVNGDGWSYQQNATSKKQAFHYALFMHSQSADPTSSGIAEQPGNDLIISLGRWTGSVGSIDQQEGTFMHELGHNLNLNHGGNTTDNCKPNYLSVMSYSRQFRESYPINRALNYSGNVLSQLVENNLVESNGEGTSMPSGQQTVWGVLLPDSTWGYNTTIVDGSGIDWNSNGVVAGTVTNGDINRLAKVGCAAQPAQTLRGHNDWNNLLFNSKGYSSWSDGIRLSNDDGQTTEFKEGKREAGAASLPTSYNYKKGGDIKHIALESSKVKSIAENDLGGQKIVNYNTLKEKTCKNEEERYKSSNNWRACWLIDNFDKKDKKIKDRSYRLGYEITTDTLKDIRFSRINTLDYAIQTLSDTSFNDPVLDKATLHKDLLEVENFINQDNLYDAIHKLLETKEHVQDLVMDDKDEAKILFGIDTNVMLFKIASTTYQSEYNKLFSNVTYGQSSYGVGDHAMITVIAPSADLDNNLVDRIFVKVASTSDQEGITINFFETGSNTGVFQQDVTLIAGSSNFVHKALHVSNGDTVTANYLGSIGTARVT